MELECTAGLMEKYVILLTIVLMKSPLVLCIVMQNQMHAMQLCLFFQSVLNVCHTWLDQHAYGDMITMRF